MQHQEREGKSYDYVRLQTPLTLLLLLLLLDSFLIIFTLIILYFKSLIKQIYLPGGCVLISVYLFTIVPEWFW